MADFSIRSDTVDVEQIMRQIRARIREKRGADYTEQEIRQLANAKLETFLDPTRVRSDLLSEFKRARNEEAAPPNYAFEDSTIYETHRGLLRSIRNLLNPILKLFFNPNPIAEALHIQAKLNTSTAERLSRMETLYYELIHNLVLEVTRLSIEVKNMKMTVDSVAGRLDFDERRARALEGAVQYRPSPARQAPAGEPSERGGERPERVPAAQGEGAERRRRRRRRGRRRQVDGAAPAQSAGATETAPRHDAGEGTAVSADSGHSDTGDSSEPDEQP
ncbi:MAG: hypothetical protein ACM36C_14390 [Acidobacteriota bacterium]